MSESVSGSVERITFHNPDTGYAVLRVKVSGKRDLVTVVGVTSGVIAGEYIQGEGRWVTDREHGVQFKADTLSSTPPHTIEGLIKYLGSGLIKGVGKHYARKIVEVFGDRTLQVIDESPSHLSEIKGIGPQRLQRIRASWEQQKGVRQIMLFLNSHGVGTARAVRIYKTYGDRAVEMVKENPYRLATDIWGVGFQTADELALKLGVPRDSPLRAAAAIRHQLQTEASRGHVGVPEPGLMVAVVELTDISEVTVRVALDDLRREREVILEEPPAESRDEAGDAPWVFLTKLYLAESNAAKALVRLTRGGHPLVGRDTDAAIAEAEGRMGIELAAGQRRAIAAALRDKVLVITGGPGVGKTTIVRAILDIFGHFGKSVTLAAPTGRAAKRLAESTGREAKTIHRLLEFDPTTAAFRKNADEPLETDLLVIDEASMLDTSLANSLLRAVPPWACLVLVGDVDQLPSVGPGAVLAELIGSGVIAVARLTEIFRQAESSWIVRAAHALNEGREPESAPPGRGDFFFVEADEPAAVIDRIVTMVRERIPAAFGLDPVRDVQVLCPMNRTELGVRNLNTVLQEALNPPSGLKVEVARFGTTFRAGDKVMQTHNDYEKEVFNGDIGRVAGVDEGEQELTVDFEGRLVVYEFDELDELTLAYAVSVHKSQGSEYPAVVIPVHTQHWMMLQRNLFYTGVTRGKRLVVLAGSRRALGIAARNGDAARRFTLLRWRLRELAGVAAGGRELMAGEGDG